MFIYVEQGDTEAYLTFASKQPHKTKFLAISYHVDHKPYFFDDLINDLRKVGWAEENAALRSLVELPPLFGRKEIHLFAKGSSSFDMWTDEEAKVHMRNARTVLRRYMIKGVPHRKLTIADLM